MYFDEKQQKKNKWVCMTQVVIVDMFIHSKRLLLVIAMDIFT